MSELKMSVARYQKTKEARLANEVINFNVYNVAMPCEIVAHYPYGTKIETVRIAHDLPKETPCAPPVTCTKLDAAQVSTHLNFQPVPYLSQGSWKVSLNQVVEVLEAVGTFLFETWKYWGLQPAKALKQGDTAIIFVGDEPQACEVLTATKGIDKSLCRVLIAGHAEWVKVAQIYTLPK